VAHPDFSQLRVITFDCYGTLVDWESGILSVLKPLLAMHHAGMADADLLKLYGELEAQNEAEEYISYREVLRNVVRGVGERLGFTPSDNEQESLPDSVPSWPPFPDTVSALQRLRARYRLGIISNIDNNLFAATAARLAVTFDFVVTAEQARAYKPSLKTFALAERSMNVPREHWLHAGQSIYHDVLPAKSLGIATAWVNRPSARPDAGAVLQAASDPDVKVSSLMELADLAA
jgi:2-haloacid dehalogenase